MKKRVITLMFTWMFAALLAAGCGKTDAPTEESVEISEEAQEDTTDTEDAAAEEAEAEADLEEEFLPEEEEPEPVLEEPVTDEWAVNLYQATLEDDYEKVRELVPDIETVRQNCAPYEDKTWAMWDYETAYRMMMSDGQVMGIIVYDNEMPQINVFVSYHEGDGFWYTGYGDHCITLAGDGTYSYIKDGKEVISTSEWQKGFVMGEDDVWAIWHM